MSKESDKTTIALIKQKVDSIDVTVTKIEDKLEKNYVTKEEFDPVKKIVFGMVGLILAGVFAALLALIIRK